MVLDKAPDIDKDEDVELDGALGDAVGGPEPPDLDIDVDDL